MSLLWGQAKVSQAVRPLGPRPASGQGGRGCRKMEGLGLEMFQELPGGLWLQGHTVVPPLEHRPRVPTTHISPAATPRLPRRRPSHDAAHSSAHSHQKGPQAEAVEPTGCPLSLHPHPPTLRGDRRTSSEEGRARE